MSSSGAKRAAQGTNGGCLAAATTASQRLSSLHTIRAGFPLRHVRFFCTHLASRDQPLTPSPPRTPSPTHAVGSASAARELKGVGKGGLGGAAYVAPAYVQPAYVQPTYVQTAYVQPAYVQPAYYAAPTYYSGYAAPAYYGTYATGGGLLGKLGRK